MRHAEQTQCCARVESEGLEMMEGSEEEEEETENAAEGLSSAGGCMSLRRLSRAHHPPLS